ncbi:ISLre2 family transposase [Streptococcus iniae]|nr:transposase [Streptococcus iniae]
MFDERELREELYSKKEISFYEFVTKYDKQMIPVMKARGYTCIHSMERTVVFTFGEFTFRRRRWKKGDQWVVPVDDKLGLDKNVRFSWEFMYHIAYLSTMMSYDKVVITVQLCYQIVITKPTVVKAVKLCQKLLKEREDYRYFEEESSIDKKPIDMIYIEGDGVMVRSRDDITDNKHFDLSHFMVHTGSQNVGGKRFALQGKKEFVSLDNRLSREKVIDYLYNHFEMDSNTLLITNSDGGHGYTPYAFKEIAKALGIKHHEHFWDEYHYKKELGKFFKSYSKELLAKAHQAISQYDKEKLRTVLDSTESLILMEEEMEEFEKFKNRLLNNFQYTKPAELRGFDHTGIGVMESQHRKITYRMKKRGMYWTRWGAETMSQMIILTYEGRFKDLFFGSWREEYEKIVELESVSAGSIKKQLNHIKREYKLHHLNKREGKKGLRFDK